MQYKVLKDWDDHKVGDVFDASTADESVTPELVSQLIVDGTLDPIIDASLYETIVVDEAYLTAHPDEEANGIMLGDEITRLKTEPELSNEEKVEEDAKLQGGEGESLSTTAEEEANPNSEVAPEKHMTYRGQTVISDGMREVNGKEYHHIRLADGSTTDVPDDEYDAMVNSAQ